MIISTIVKRKELKERRKSRWKKIMEMIKKNHDNALSYIYICTSLYIYYVLECKYDVRPLLLKDRRIRIHYKNYFWLSTKKTRELNAEIYASKHTGISKIQWIHAHAYIISGYSFNGFESRELSLVLNRSYSPPRDFIFEYIIISISRKDYLLQKKSGRPVNWLTTFPQLTLI